MTDVALYQGLQQSTVKLLDKFGRTMTYRRRRMVEYDSGSGIQDSFPEIEEFVGVELMLSQSLIEISRIQDATSQILALLRFDPEIQDFIEFGGETRVIAGPIEILRPGGITMLYRIFVN